MQRIGTGVQQLRRDHEVLRARARTQLLEFSRAADEYSVHVRRADRPQPWQVNRVGLIGNLGQVEAQPVPRIPVRHLPGDVPVVRKRLGFPRRRIRRRLDGIAEEDLRGIQLLHGLRRDRSAAAREQEEKRGAK